MRARLCLLAASLYGAALSTPVGACTLWAAASDVEGGGTLLSKNRDWAPDHRQILKLVRPKKGWAYYGLFAEGNDSPRLKGLKSGINERGLALVTATSNIPPRLQDDAAGIHGLSAKILAEYESVSQLAADAKNLFSRARPTFLLLADRTQVMSLEVGLDGRFKVVVRDRGTLAHTNHYLDPELAATYNSSKVGASSKTRYERVQTLLAATPRPYTIERFSAISRDRHDGPNNSLWRSGKEATLSSWILRIPASGPPRLRLLMANPGETEATHDVRLDAAFWRRPAD